jgi:DNA-binding NtrC family response regulator
VDDDEGLRESCRLILEEEFEVLDAADAAQGLETLRRHEVDVVLLDVRLPGMDGLEALQHIKALDEHVEVILVTAVRTVTAVTAMARGLDYLEALEEEVLGLVRRASTAAPCSAR